MSLSELLMLSILLIIFKMSFLCVSSNLQVFCDCVRKYCLYISLSPSTHIFDTKSVPIFANIYLDQYLRYYYVYIYYFQMF